MAEVAGWIFVVLIGAKGNGGGDSVLITDRSRSFCPSYIVIGACPPLGGLGRAVIEVFPGGSRCDQGGVD